MQLKVGKSRLKGSVSVPASKSYTIRAVAVASLAKGQSRIINPLISSDSISAAACYKALGADIDTTDKTCWKVTGTGGDIKPPADIIDVGNSGTTLRIAAGSAALARDNNKIRFTGDEQIQSRPIKPLLDSLSDLGAKAVSIKDNGKAPIEITGRLNGGQTTLECVTSQYLSSLLLCCPLAAGDSEINVTLLNEPDYVQMTLDWLDKQGIKYQNNKMKKFIIEGNQSYNGFELPVPADFSSATFFLCAAALMGDEVTLTGLDFNDSQPDKAVVDYLKAMGADIEIDDNSVTVRSAQLKGIEIDMNRTPDALPAMAVTAAFAQGPTKLYNVAQARNKETDRIRCMAQELKKMGIVTEELPDGLIIEGGKAKACDLKGYSDHRIVMALSIAAMAIEGTSVIDTAEAMNVTFPNYVELMKIIGANIELQ